MSVGADPHDSPDPQSDRTRLPLSVTDAAANDSVVETAVPLSAIDESPIVVPDVALGNRFVVRPEIAEIVPHAHAEPE